MNTLAAFEVIGLSACAERGPAWCCCALTAEHEGDHRCACGEEWTEAPSGKVIASWDT